MDNKRVKRAEAQEAEKGLSRRSFLKGAGIGAVSLVAAGGALTACSPTAEAPSGGGTQTGTPSAGSTPDTQASTSSWKIKPEEVTSFAKELDFDVVVVGHGRRCQRCQRCQRDSTSILSVG